MKKNSLETVEGNVRKILEKYPETRNNDLLLILCYLRYVVHLKCYGSEKPHRLWIQDKDVNSIKSLDGIKRVRQKIQNEYHKFMPTDPEIRKRRKISEDIFKKYATD